MQYQAEIKATKYLAGYAFDSRQSDDRLESMIRILHNEMTGEEPKTDHKAIIRIDKADKNKIRQMFKRLSEEKREKMYKTFIEYAESPRTDPLLLNMLLPLGSEVS